MLTVTVLHNADFPTDDEALEEPEDPPDAYGHAARAEVREVAHAVAAALASRARVYVVPIRSSADLARALRLTSPDVVFNLCESLAGDARYEPQVALALARAGVPYTGNPASVLRLCLDKLTTSAALARAGIPAPASWALGGEDAPEGLPYPVIVKPRCEDGSLGIGARSVARDPADLRAAVADLRRTVRGPLMAQRYVEGRELNVSLLGGDAGLQVLPLGEIDFGEMPPDHPRIVTYDAKWTPGHPAWRGTTAVDAVVEPALARRIEQLARGAAALGLRGYARLDLRVDTTGIPYVVDVNPNCDLAPDAGLARAAGRAGIDFTTLCWRIVRAALEGASTPLSCALVRRRPPTRVAAPMELPA